MEFKCLTEVGYRALDEIRLDDPQLFLDSDIARLKEVLEAQVGDKAWGPRVDLRCSLNPLNDEVVSGPDLDARHARVLDEALALAPADVYRLGESLWTSLNCFVLGPYVPKRWERGLTAGRDKKRFVRSHWFGDNRKDNAAARLWWLCELSRRAARFGTRSEQELLGAMANNVGLYHQAIARPYLISNPKVLGTLYDVAMTSGNEHLFKFNEANRWLQALNLRAGASAIDLMSQDELRTVIEEAVPPKEP